MKANLVRATVVLLALSVVWLAFGCGAGYRTTSKNGHQSVYRIDEDGNKTLVYEVTKDGQLTVHDENDPRSKKAIAAKERVEEMERVRDERFARIEAAPKRNIEDPIFVALHDTELGPNLGKSEKSKGAVFEQIRQEFENDDVITLIDPSAKKSEEIAQLGKMLAGASPDASPVADVEVFTKAYLKEVTGVSKKTGKVGSAVAVIFEATITSNYLPAEYTVSESGNVFQNVQVTKNLAEKIKNVIKEKIGPTVPADRSL